MCLSQPHPRSTSSSALALPPLVRDADDARAFTNTLDTMARRPAWTLRGVFKPTNRAGLPRRFHTKINLNEYWGALEKVVKVEVSWPRADKENAAAAAARPDDAMDVDNAVNENLANERAERSQMENVVEVKVAAAAPPSPVKVVDDAPPAKRSKGRRRSTPTSPASACATPCATPPPCNRVPLGALNGMGSRGHIRKTLSPLSTFADNLARRLARQH